MRRDFELIRKILIGVANQPAGTGNFIITFPGEYEKSVVFAHIELMINEGLIDGTVSRSMDKGVSQAVVSHLTWKGHDFIDGIESDANWSKVKKFLFDGGKLITIETIKFAIKELFTYSK